MGWHNGRLSFQEMPDCSFHLSLGGIAVSGEDTFDFPCRKFYGLHATPNTRQENDTTNLTKGDTRFGISLQGKDAFNNHQVGCFGIQNRAEFRKNMIESAGQGLSLGGSNRTEGILSNSGASSLHNTETSISQPGIYADDLDRRFQGSG